MNFRHAVNRFLKINAGGHQTEQNARSEGSFRPGLALRRLMYVAAIGCFIIVGYAVRHAREDYLNILSIASVGLMVGGAALLSGGLLGFLFGVPRTREDVIARQATEATDREASRDPSRTYVPSTSLEQIADWLTKILVGVGLVQIQSIPGKLTGLASYVAGGLGTQAGSETFALAILIYFGVCGFVFGFLWARIYLPRWFREADDIQVLEKKVTQLEKDARALALIQKQLNREPDDPPATDDEVAKAIKVASKPVKVQIFSQAEKTSANTNASDFDVKIEGVISIFRGLINSDSDERYHRNHSELAHALLRKKPRDWQGAEEAFSKAIKIRNNTGVKGWKSYEFHRSRCRIEMDENFKKGQPSSASDTAAIISDLKTVYRDTDKWKRRSDPNSSEAAAVIKAWRDLNNVSNDNVLAS